ncbi:MAG: SDR family oxidoreductase [Oscillospiraceae bacterium]|jgi:3-oxoacyl-[acyl-carrier protein] reductase|nr:SDR family oxidoreductase [Oscillospiraceae bacterium]
MEILKGKIALITGASGGIGSCIARRFAQDGISLALLGRSEEKLAATAASVREYGVETLLLPGDLLDDAYLEDCFAAVKERFGGLDILVNNAGMALSRSFEETTMAEFDRIMALNARVPYLACHLALPLLRCSECASILNIASVVAHKGYPLQSAYAASKHALAGFTKSLASEVYREDIRVHLISPGGVFTDMVRIARPDLTGEDMILPEDIAEIAAFFIEHRTNAVIDEICVHRSGKEPFL